MPRTDPSFRVGRVVSTGAASSSEKDVITVNALGDTKTFTDRNGNVHTITRDVLGRTTIDAVTTLGAGVDGAIRRIETAFDGQGNAYKITNEAPPQTDQL